MKLDYKVFEKAARNIATGIDSYFACTAICICNPDGGGEKEYYIDLFKPEGVHKNVPWFGLPIYITEDTQLSRSLSLLFTAEVLKGEQND